MLPRGKGRYPQYIGQSIFELFKNLRDLGVRSRAVDNPRGQVRLLHTLIISIIIKLILIIFISALFGLHFSSMVSPHFSEDCDG